MGDRMKIVPFTSLLDRVIEEYESENSIFGIREADFFRYPVKQFIDYNGEKISNLVGPAAGPHTQMAQNLAAAYLSGGRFFELKTVQVLDSLSFPKPCIYAEDECYNTEWSTELSIEDACSEYVKGWFLLFFLAGEIFGLNVQDYIFNMSVAYDLDGIKSSKVDRFIDNLKDASGTDVFQECRTVLFKKAPHFRKFDPGCLENLSPHICSSIALSTMHGCPPEEIESICEHLLGEKELHTYIKLNPTLLGYKFVRQTLDQMGYGYIRLSEESFDKDLNFDQACSLITKINKLAAEKGRKVGIKLSNTLPVKITSGELPGNEMYLSGRPLYPLTINLAYSLAAAFKGEICISYCGGADHKNAAQIVESGIYPVTVATTLLKPGGYNRLKKLSEAVAPVQRKALQGIRLDQLKKLAERSINETVYRKMKQRILRKPAQPLPVFDCRESCRMCTDVCPNRANHLVTVSGDGFKFSRQVLHLDHICNECGNCSVFCPEKGEPYRDKFTYFQSENDFYDSSNNGFLGNRNGQLDTFLIRVNGKVLQVGSDAINKSGVSESDCASYQFIREIIANYSYLLL